MLKLEDNSLMPFGQYAREGKTMMEVPPSYLFWLKGEFDNKDYLSEQEQAINDYIISNADALNKEKESQEKADKRAGFYIITRSGFKGILYHDEARVNGKSKVMLTDDKFRETGQGMLCDPKTLIIKGCIN